jgi:hypothetical protein
MRFANVGSPWGNTLAKDFAKTPYDADLDRIPANFQPLPPLVHRKKRGNPSQIVAKPPDGFIILCLLFQHYGLVVDPVPSFWNRSHEFDDFCRVLCMYQKPKPIRSGDEVRQESLANS